MTKKSTNSISQQSYMFDVWVISLAAVINGSTLDVCYRISIVDTVVVISCTLLLTLNVSLFYSGKLFYALSDSHLLPPWLWMHREDNNQYHDKSCRSPSPLIINLHNRLLSLFVLVFLISWCSVDVLLTFIFCHFLSASSFMYNEEQCLLLFHNFVCCFLFLFR